MKILWPETFFTLTFLTFLRINAVIILLTRNNLYSGLHFQCVCSVLCNCACNFVWERPYLFEARGNFLVPAWRLSLLKCGNGVRTCCFRGESSVPVWFLSSCQFLAVLDSPYFLGGFWQAEYRQVVVYHSGYGSSGSDLAILLRLIGRFFSME